jgi:hypothetical protein
MMSVVRRLRDRWNIRRERKKRLNAARYAGGSQGNFKTDLDVNVGISRRDYPRNR